MLLVIVRMVIIILKVVLLVVELVVMVDQVLHNPKDMGGMQHIPLDLVVVEEEEPHLIQIMSSEETVVPES